MVLSKSSLLLYLTLLLLFLIGKSQ